MWRSLLYLKISKLEFQCKEQTLMRFSMQRFFYANVLFASCSLFVIPKENRCEEGAPEFSCEGNTLVFCSRSSGFEIREECGEEALCNPNAAPPRCELPVAAFCGDGETQQPEQCDNGQNINNENCNADCTTPRCGDAVFQSENEDCDDGNILLGDGCDSNCQFEEVTQCGNGTVEAGEGCDDGNFFAGDGCRPNCTPESCGDGVNTPGDFCLSATPLILPATPTGTATCSLNFADLDRDGDLDIVTGAVFGSNYAFLRNNGNETFQGAIQINSLNEPRSVEFGDLNADGKLDLISVDTGDHIGVVHLGNGNGTFAPAIALDLRPSVGVALDNRPVDLNRDGKLDALVTYAGQLGIFGGNGNGTFQAGILVPSSGLFSGDTNSVEVGDLNNDGIPDAVMSAANVSRLIVLFGTGGLSFGPENILPVSGVRAQTASLGDVDLDGDLDILASTNTTAGVQLIDLFLNNGAGAFVPPQEIAIPNTTLMGESDLIDLNNDGLLDIVVILINQGANKIAVLPGRGDATFGLPRFFNHPGAISGEGSNLLYERDLNRDGHLDIGVVMVAQDSVGIFFSDP
jgi:cysteine-rich repeat protein